MRALSQTDSLLKINGLAAWCVSPILPALVETLRIRRHGQFSLFCGCMKDALTYQVPLRVLLDTDVILKFIRKQLKPISREIFKYCSHKIGVCVDHPDGWDWSKKADRKRILVITNSAMMLTVQSNIYWEVNWGRGVNSWEGVTYLCKAKFLFVTRTRKKCNTFQPFIIFIGIHCCLILSKLLKKKVF